MGVIEEFVYSVNFRKYFIVIFVDVIISGGKFWLIKFIFENFF